MMNNTETQSKNLHNYVVDKIIKNNNDYIKLFANINSSIDFDSAFGVLTANANLSFEAFGNYTALMGNYSDLIIKKMMGVSDEKSKQTALKIVDALSNELQQAKITQDDFISFLFAAHNLTTKFEVVNELPHTREKIITDFFQGQKDLMLNEIKEPLKLTPKLNSLINELFTSSGLTVTVDYAQSISLLRNKISLGELIKHDLIVINNYIYKNATFSKSGDILLISKILQNAEYKNLLDLSMEKFDKQKYGLLYIESILSNIGKISCVNSPINISLANITKTTDLTFNMLANENKKSEKSEEPTLKVVKDLHAPKDKSIKTKTKYRNKPYVINGNDSIHTYLYKTFWNAGIGLLDQEGKETAVPYPVAFLKSVEGVYGSEYQQEIVNIIGNALKTPFAQIDKIVWKNDLINDCLSDITLKIRDLNAEFEKNIKIYMSNLPKSKAKVIVDMINDLISTALITTANEEITVRGLLIEQLNSNKIFTHKQLNQFIDVMEKCEILTENVDKYAEFVEYIESDKKITEALQLSMKCNETQNKQQFYVLISKLLKQMRIGVVKK